MEARIGDCDHSCQNASICPTSESSDKIKDQPDPVSEKEHVNSLFRSKAEK